MDNYTTEYWNRMQKLAGIPSNSYLTGSAIWVGMGTTTPNHWHIPTPTNKYADIEDKMFRLNEKIKRITRIVEVCEYDT